MRTILLIEDSEDDISILTRACQRSGIPHNLSIVQDGQAAVDYLAGAGPYADRSRYPMPNIVFLDIKVPKLNGFEVLQWVRLQPSLKNLPIVILTGSDQLKDINRAYKLGVTSYLLKNGDVAEFSLGIDVLLKYWFELNKLPS